MAASDFLRLPTSSFAIALDLVLLSLLSVVILLIYRLYLSPLAKIPGPKLAAATSWYEFYFDCILAGKYVFEVDRMHEEYGPIVRINPWEVHIKDSDFYDQIYSLASKLDKDHWYYRFVDSSLSGFATANAELHRIRRAPVAKYFSPASIARLEPLIRECVGKLCLRMKEREKTGIELDLANAYRGIGSDVISEYSIPEAPVRLDEPDFGAGYNRVLRDMAQVALWHRHFGFVLTAMNYVPRWLVKMADSGGHGLAVYDNVIRIRNQAKLVIETNGVPPASKTYPVILCGIYNSDLPPSEKTLKRLEQEAMTLIGAGTETTGNTLSVTTFHLLSNPPMLQKLKAELAGLTMEDPNGIISYRQLEPLPYLNACISEGLRLGSSVSSRMPRKNRHAPIRYKDYTLPAGTTVSMCQRDVHLDPNIYPDPHTFNPERWLDPVSRKNLDRYFVPFSKGSRNCVGMNLAMANLQMTLANIFRRFDLKLYHTTIEDISLVHDFFAPFGPLDSKGVRVTVE